MAGVIKNLLDILKLKDTDEEFEEYEMSELKNTSSAKRASGGSDIRTTDRSAERDRTRTSASSSYESRSASSDSGLQVRKAHSTSNYGSSTYIERRNDSKTLRMERPEGSKVVPIKTTRAGLEVCVMKPRSFEESQDICDVLLSECCAIVNLEDNDIAVSRRVMDFIYGVVYSINGKLIQISDLIFIVAPGNVDVSGDYNDILAQTGYEFPSLN